VSKLKGSDVSGEEKKDHLVYCRGYLAGQGLADHWEPVVCRQDQLFIDLDSPEAHNIFHEQWPLFLEHWPKSTYLMTVSKSGNQHVIVKLGFNVTDAWRVAVQACLGSDLKRELLHLVSFEKQELNPIILFERKVEVAI
jgi:hypothetical protein